MFVSIDNVTLQQRLGNQVVEAERYLFYQLTLVDVGQSSRLLSIITIE